jgi:hypothetical protein
VRDDEEILTNPKPERRLPPPPATRAQLSRRRAHPRRRVASRNGNFCASNANRDTFNCDVFGLPQNEESVAYVRLTYTTFDFNRPELFEFAAEIHAVRCDENRRSSGLLHPEDVPATPLNQQDNYLTITGISS